MLLQRLCDYSERLDLPPPLYVEGPVRYLIELGGDGRLLKPQPTDTADPGDRRTRRGLRRLVPQVQRSSGIKPFLLADKADYVLGYVGEDGKPDRVRHHAFLDLLDRCAVETEEPAVLAVQRFLRADPLGQLDLGDTFDATGIITFSVEGMLPIDLPTVRAFWAREHDPSLGGAPIMQCLICGQERPVLDRLQAKIKGVPGGQTSGTVIIGANAPAFESFRLEASLIAPTCADCGERFTKAANALLASELNRVVLGGSAFIFWTREEVGFDPMTFLTEPKGEDVEQLLRSVQRGTAIPDVDQTRFYATTLSGSGGRTVVRDWIDTTVGEVKRSLLSWFQRQALVGAYGEQPQPLSVNALAGATVREFRDLAPYVPRVLLHAALSGTPPPPGLLYQAVRRNRAEQTVTRPRAALIKLALIGSSELQGERYMVQLQIDHSDPAYHCGRLLAVLEQIQRAALPGINATIVDRFFGTASSAPVTVFARLVRGAQPHLAKLERDRRGAYVALQRRMEEIISRLPSFPRVLTLEQQGLFALGYYHQRAHDRAQAREAALRGDRALAAAAGEAIESSEDEGEDS